MKPGAVLVMNEHAPRRRKGPLPEDAIVYADRDLVLIDKPAEMLSVADEAGNKDTLLVPLDYLMDATDWHRVPPAFRPGKAAA